MKNIKTTIWSAMLLTVATVTSCTDQLELSDTPPQQELMSKTEIDDLIAASLQETDEFNWNQVSDKVMWSALVHSDSTLIIGYKPANEGDISKKISQININEEKWVSAGDIVIEELVQVANDKQGGNLKSQNINAFKHDVLPFLIAHSADIEAISKLRSHPNVRYIEPLGYEMGSEDASSGREESFIGCGNSSSYNIPTSDYYTISPNAKVPWNYSYMNIESAWNYTTGRGIGVGLIDTGISPYQSKLGSEFNSGQSSGRYISKYGTFVSSWWWWWASPDGPNDRCGHGTAMAGTIAAPRSTSGSSVGVAYNCNLISYRGTGDVIINSSTEKIGVSNALVGLGNRSDVKIISMSLGDVFYNSMVADAIRYANGRGKLIFSAAGTSTPFTNWLGVTFPANMNETVAVTGIKEGSYNRCTVCHSGSKVDFTVVMERIGTQNLTLTLPMSGSQPSRIGGSSIATATAAGIAALVWSRHPQWNKNQVLNKMVQTADLYPYRDANYGWGTLNAANAVK